MHTSPHWAELSSCIYRKHLWTARGIWTRKGTFWMVRWKSINGYGRDPSHPLQWRFLEGSFRRASRYLLQLEASIAPLNLAGYSTCLNLKGYEPVRLYASSASVCSSFSWRPDLRWRWSFVFTITYIRGDLHHGPRAVTKEKWINFMVKLHKNIISRALGLFIKCKRNLEREEWLCTKKWMCSFLNDLILIENVQHWHAVKKIVQKY